MADQKMRLDLILKYEEIERREIDKDVRWEISMRRMPNFLCLLLLFKWYLEKSYWMWLLVNSKNILPLAQKNSQNPEIALQHI